MNSDFSQLSKEERDLRMTALILGELSAEEAEETRQAIAADAELTREFEQRKQTIELVRETTAMDRKISTDGTPLKLDDGRRQKLLESFKTPALREVQPRRPRNLWYVPMSIAAILVGLLVIVATEQNFRSPRMMARASRLPATTTRAESASEAALAAISFANAEPDRPRIDSSFDRRSSLGSELLSSVDNKITSGLQGRAVGGAGSELLAKTRSTLTVTLPAMTDADEDRRVQIGGQSAPLAPLGDARKSIEEFSEQSLHEGIDVGRKLQIERPPSIETKNPSASAPVGPATANETKYYSFAEAAPIAQTFDVQLMISSTNSSVAFSESVNAQADGSLGLPPTAGKPFVAAGESIKGINDQAIRSANDWFVDGYAAGDVQKANRAGSGVDLGNRPATATTINGRESPVPSVDYSISSKQLAEKAASATPPPGMAPQSVAQPPAVPSVEGVDYVNGNVAPANRIQLPVIASEGIASLPSLSSQSAQNSYSFRFKSDDAPGRFGKDQSLSSVDRNGSIGVQGGATAGFGGGAIYAGVTIAPDGRGSGTSRASGGIQNSATVGATDSARPQDSFGVELYDTGMMKDDSRWLLRDGVAQANDSLGSSGGGRGGRGAFGNRLGGAVNRAAGPAGATDGNGGALNTSVSGTARGFFDDNVNTASVNDPNKAVSDTSGRYRAIVQLPEQANATQLDRESSPTRADGETKLLGAAGYTVESLQGVDAAGLPISSTATGQKLEVANPQQAQSLTQPAQPVRPSSGITVYFANAGTTVFSNAVIGLERKLAGTTASLGPESTETKVLTEKLKTARDELNDRLANTERAAEDGLEQISKSATPQHRSAAPIPQPEIFTRENAFSTFSLNVSDVSFKLAAASLEKGAMPEAAGIRSEEFINAFDYRDPMPAPGVPIAFAWERARYPFAHNRDVLRFSIKTAAQGREAGKPLNIVLALDNSGSMERADRVRIIQESLRTLAAQLKPQDKLSVVTFSRTASLRVDGASGTNAIEAAKQVSALTPEGGTNLEDALDLAYRTALRHYAATAVNRVVLLTDGAANLGNVEPKTLKAKVESFRKQGVALDCFGIGWEGFNDDLLEQLSRNGDGRYGFVNTPEEAASEFVGQLAGALRVAASDVKVQVEFNPKRVTAYRQIGYAKHQLTKEQFRDNKVDAAELGAAEAGNALYVVETNPRGEGPIATVRARFRIPNTSDYREHEWVVPFGSSVELEQSSPALRLAASASAFSEWLAASPYAGEVTTDRLLGILSGVPEIYGADPRPKKLEWMIRQAKSISGK